MFLKRITKKRWSEIGFFTLMIIIPIIHFCIFWIGVNVNSFALAFEGRNGFTFDYFKLFFQELTTPGPSNKLLEGIKNTLIIFALNNFILLPLSVLFSYFLCEADKHVRAGCFQFRLSSDGYYIVCREGKLYLGGKDRGVIYAVFAFLEKFAGCRFFAPDEEYIPQSAEISVPEGYEEHYSPVFFMRDVLWSTNYDIDWSVKQKVNRGHYRNFFGGTGGEVGFAGYFGHTLGELAETGYDAPEPCLTDENIYQTVLKNVRKRLQENPGAAFVSISQNDDFRVCKCEKCAAIDAREESHAGTMIHFVNRIAEELESEFPNVKFHTFAYIKLDRNSHI